MNCNHIILDGRICDSCGQIICPFQLIQGWPQLINKQLSFPLKNNLNKELIKCGIPYKYLRLFPNIISTISKKTNCKIKGKRKKALVFAILYDIEKGDPDELRLKINLTREQCIKGVKLYEEHINFLNINWKTFLLQKLNKLNFNFLYEEISNNIIKQNSNIPISELIYLNILSCLKKYNIPKNLKLINNEFILKNKKINR